MMSQKLLEIERSIRALSLKEQLWLLERIARQVRERTNTDELSANIEDLEEQLAMMASDLEIQTELETTNREFAVAENDGLEQL